MNRKTGLVITILLALTLSACASKTKKTEPVRSEPVVQDTTSPLIGTTGMTAEQLAQYGIIGDPLDYKIVYFEYNSSAIDKRSEIIASAHARELASRGGAKVALEGHADERGTRDYNLALGERRSQAVGDLMKSVGVGSSEIRNVSYGEERPVDTAHNEAAWQKNRRVEISY